MKKLIYFICFLLISSVSYALNYVIDYAIFSTEDQSPYIEVYLSINGNSISYANVEGENYQGKLEVTYMIKNGEDIISFEKFQLNSPLYKEEDMKLDLIDLKRLPIKNGNYKLDFKIKDIITGAESASSQALRPIDFKENQLAISDILLADEVKKSEGEPNDFVRNGVEIIPNFSHNYIDNLNQIHFYVEIYHADQSDQLDDAYLLEYMVIDQSTQEIAANLRSAKRQNALGTSVILSSFNMDNLASGAYDLKINIKDRSNQLVMTKSISFYRINSSFVDYASQLSSASFVDSITNIEELKEYIKSLFHISTDNEVEFANNQLKYSDLDLMQRYFLNFWKTRNPADPEGEWKEYKAKVKLVDEEFGYGNIKGYQTERGRVYLQYGAPNSVQNVPYQRDSHPYSVWQYYQLNGVSDRKFIFYSPSMEMLGYEVLHSNVRGEVSNPGWEATLLNPTGNIIRNAPQGVENEEAKSLFNNPR